MIEEAAELDRDDDSEDEEEQDGATAKLNGKGKERAVNDDEAEEGEQASEDEEEESSDEDDDEDETAELLRELEKIKRERAEEKARQENERAASAAISAEEAAASGNPLLNLQAALSGNRTFDSPGGYAASSAGSSTVASFQIKKRWDDDVIFKNQAVKSDEPRKEFVNDAIRTNFHKRFLQCVPGSWSHTTRMAS